MRSEVTDRYYRVYTYQNVDRVPDLEFGYWPQTIRRWISEGAKIDMTPQEINSMFSGKFDAFFGLEGEGTGIGAACFMHPSFEHEVIERKEHSVIERGGDGVVAERFEAAQDESSIPHFIDFPIKTPADWQEMRKRYRRDDPVRKGKDSDFAHVREAMARGAMVTLHLCGPYGQLRNWMGFENLSTAFYDYPEMIHDMMESFTELIVDSVEAAPADIPIDQVSWWEDMASRNGPFVSPRMFREFLQPAYHAVMQAAKKRGCVLGIVDCDGNPHDIVGNWLEEGVNIMFPMEVAAGVDAAEWRKEWGLDLRMRGGIAKVPLAQDKSAIDAELERIRPLLDQGGFIPHLDHLVPPDISYANYCYYREKKMKMIGK
ncbi:MAG: uroporphyrinogen decarboxylase family protein [Planctomycetaceae bacterium]|nr:hypothetical protein [Planctomycetaceae bacterium]